MKLEYALLEHFQAIRQTGACMHSSYLLYYHHANGVPRPAVSLWTCLDRYVLCIIDGLILG